LAWAWEQTPPTYAQTGGECHDSWECLSSSINRHKRWIERHRLSGVQYWVMPVNRLGVGLSSEFMELATTNMYFVIKTKVTFVGSPISPQLIQTAMIDGSAQCSFRRENGGHLVFMAFGVHVVNHVNEV
jgi:hypothetical protein